jgi:hypothetical protein
MTTIGHLAGILLFTLLSAAVNTMSDTIRQANLRESNAERIGKLERNYLQYIAELRRRYSLD